MTVTTSVETVATVITALLGIASLIFERRRAKGATRPLPPASVKDVLNAANDTTRVELKRLQKTMTRAEFAQRLKNAEAHLRAQEKALATTKMPPWAFGLLTPEDAQRYGWEWGAHLHQLVEEGEIRQARRDRRRFVIAAVALAAILRVRRALGRAR